jgi:hypothetical protein
LKGLNLFFVYDILENMHVDILVLRILFSTIASSTLAQFCAKARSIALLRYMLENMLFDSCQPWHQSCQEVEEAHAGKWPGGMNGPVDEIKGAA